MHVDELIQRAKQAAEDHRAYGRWMCERHGGERPRWVANEELERQGVLAGLMARVDALHAAVRDLYEAGVAPEEIAAVVDLRDHRDGSLSVWGVHQITKTLWCDYCGTPESEAAWLTSGPNNICDRCLALASRVLAERCALAANELVEFRRCADGTCRMCNRCYPPDPHDLRLTPVEGRLERLPLREMLVVRRITGGHEARICDRCVANKDRRFRTPPEQIKRMLLM